MAQPFVGQIVYTGFSFAPRGYAQCNGQILSIQQNTALFSLLGTYYGGNGVSNFQLPDMRSRVPIHQGQGNGLTVYDIGEQTGTENHTLLSGEMPIHNHVLVASTNKAETEAPAANSSLLGRAIAVNQVPFVYIPSGSSTGTVALNTAALGMTGSSTPIPLIQPILTVNCNIALTGVYPSRN